MKQRSPVPGFGTLSSLATLCLLAGCDLPPGGYGYQGGGPGYNSSYSGYGSAPVPERRERAERLHISDAVWEASDGKRRNATEIVRSECERSTSCRLRADNRYLGGDPSPGHVKRLTVRYRCGSGQETETISENRTQTISCE